MSRASSFSWSAIRSDARSSSAPPDRAVACSIRSLMFCRTMAMRSSSSGIERSPLIASSPSRAQRQRSAPSADRPIVIPAHERFRVAATGLAGGSAAVVLHRPQSMHFADPTATAACGAGLGQELNELRARGGRLFHHSGVITPQYANRHPPARPPSALHLQDVPGSLQPPCPIALKLCNSQVQPVPSQRHVLVRRARSFVLGAGGFFIMARVITRRRRKSPAGGNAAAEEDSPRIGRVRPPSCAICERIPRRRREVQPQAAKRNEVGRVSEPQAQPQPNGPTLGFAD